MTYADYIKADKLPLVEPRSPRKKDPDEPFFIRTHQAFEIWFSQILDELEYARKLLARSNVPEKDCPLVEQHVRRAAEIFDLLRAHLPLLESLDTSSFYDFRRPLFGASGSQSVRFIEVEWTLGLFAPDLLEYLEGREPHEKGLGATAKNPEPGTELSESKRSDARIPARADLERRSLRQYRSGFSKEALEKRGVPDLTARFESHPAVAKRHTVRRWLFEWLRRTPFPPLGDGQPDKPDPANGPHFHERLWKALAKAQRQDMTKSPTGSERRAVEIEDSMRQLKARFDWFAAEDARRAIVFILQFAEQPLLSRPAALLNAFLQLDEALTNWRERHVTMVARVLGGGRISTMGQAHSGLDYLFATVHKRAFPELWDARTFLLGTREARSMYPKIAWSGYEFKFDGGA